MDIETDYLIIGAGAAGMGFADTLVGRSDADVVLVDRRPRPGGHWNDDYVFVRLHQPSAYYGVDSLTLGEDRLDETGPNAGFYERASGAEVCAYYERALSEHLLPTGRVRFLGMTEYRDGASGEHVLASLLTGATTSVRVRRKVVDATYIATTIPSMHKPSFSVHPDARVIAPNDLVHLSSPASSFTVIGAGKTSMDTCCWLIEHGVPPRSIRWIRPRDPYFIDRAWMQPLGLLGSLAEWLARQNEAAAVATDLHDLLRLLEKSDVLRRLDPEVEPSVYRGVTLSEGEWETLASITNVVRRGRVLNIGVDQIDLEEGSVSTTPDEVHIDCSAPGLGKGAPKPVFEPDRITIQRVQAGIDPFSHALIGVVEASDRDIAEKNRLCPPVHMSGEAIDFGRDLLITLRARMSWMAEADVRDWFVTTRLNPLRGAFEHVTDAARASLTRLVTSTAPAIENLERIVAAADRAR